MWSNNRRGFSIVELLTVIAIMAILAAIIFPAMAGAKRKARESKCISNMAQIYAAVNLFKQDENRYPDFIAGPVEYKDVDGNIHHSYQDGYTLVPFGETKGLYNGELVSLYPEYIKSTSDLTCPDAVLNAERTSFKKEDTVADPMYTYWSLTSDPVVNTKSVRAQGPTSEGVTDTPFLLYKMSTYDCQLPKKVASDPTNNLYEAWESHYSTAWYVLSPTYIAEYPDASAEDTGMAVYLKDHPEYARQLLWKEPSAQTVVTWCSYHRDCNPDGTPRASSKDMVLYLDGHTKRVDSKELENNNDTLNWYNVWRLAPSGS